MKSLIFTLSLLCSLICNSQYIGVKARYTETILVTNPGFPPSRENRLILSFYHVTSGGVYTPVSLSNFDIGLYKTGFQYSTVSGDYLDSAGNNYPGYLYTAPRVISYYNSVGLNYVDCSPNTVTHLTVNGHELVIDYIQVSHWIPDAGSSIGVREIFTAPQICLPFYFSGDPYASVPGNVNFQWPVPPAPPYNWTTISCAGNPDQLIIRGVLQHYDEITTLPVKFANVGGSLDGSCKGIINWSNLSESNIHYYQVERSVDGGPFQPLQQVLPTNNSGGRADYLLTDSSVITGINFYQVKAIENSGTSFQSTVVKIKGCTNLKAPRLSVYPNPARTGRFYLQVTDLPAGVYSISILNATGQLMKLSEVQHAGGALNKLYELSYKAPGLYTVLLRSGDLSLSQKVLITD